MDIDNVVGHHQYIRLLLDTEREVLANKEHLENVDDIAHPTGVMRGVESLRHLQRGFLSGEKLENILNCFTFIYGYRLSISTLLFVL